MSASPQITYQTISADPHLRDICDMVIKEVMGKLNCHKLVTIQSFDPVKQTATATVNYTKTIFVASAPGVFTPTAVSFPVMIDCPVYFTQGGGGSLTFPVEQGDQAEAHFHDADMDNWLASGIVGPAATVRQHAFTDAILFVGVNPFKSALSNFDTVRGLLQLAGSKVGVGPDGVLIESSGVKLSKGLSDLVTALNNFMAVLAALPPTPVLGAALSVPATAAQTAITLAGTEISEVLE